MPAGAVLVELTREQQIQEAVQMGLAHADRKDKIISKLYYDKAGYGSIDSVYKNARKQNNTISKRDVQVWFDTNIIKTAHAMGPQGKNSFVAPHKGYEYQMDLFFIKDLKKQKYNAGFLMIDIFTKYATVVPIDAKNGDQVAMGLIQSLKEMKDAQDVDNPKIIYCDGETAWTTGAVPTYIEEQGIKQYITRNHAQFAERFVRTYKGMLYKRIDSAKREEVQGVEDPKERPKPEPKPEGEEEEEEEEDEDPDPQWHTFNHQILLTYNNFQVHSATKMTPKQAAKNSSQIDVKNNLELKATHNRRYPPLAVGDTVVIRRKKGTGEKERTSNWGDDPHKVASIDEEFGQKYYTLDHEDRQYTRGEVLKIS